MDHIFINDRKIQVGQTSNWLDHENRKQIFFFLFSVLMPFLMFFGVLISDTHAAARGRNNVHWIELKRKEREEEETHKMLFGAKSTNTRTCVTVTGIN